MLYLTIKYNSKNVMCNVTYGFILVFYIMWNVDTIIKRLWGEK